MPEGMDRRLVLLVAALEEIPGVAVLTWSFLLDAELNCPLPPERWDVTVRVEQSARGWFALRLLMGVAAWVHHEVEEYGSSMSASAAPAGVIGSDPEAAEFVDMRLEGKGCVDPELLADCITLLLARARP